jgi:type IV pilus assembly protein PilY1
MNFNLLKSQLVLAAWLLSVTLSYAGVAQFPLFLTTSSDPNILFNMSIEVPMGGAAYNDQPNAVAATSCGGRITSGGGEVGVCYFKDRSYLGYFDPDKCYDYSATGGGRFEPKSATLNINHECTGKFSGNFMNWATMTAMDMFILTTTGGNRVIDTVGASAETVIRRARKINNDGWFPYKLVTSVNNVAPSTVTPWADSAIYIHNTDSPDAFTVDFGTTRGGNQKATYKVQVKVCDPVIGLEDNCVPYGNSSYYKPEGLIQKNADHMRFGVTSYTNTSGNGIDGGVLRSNMKYVGILKPNGSGSFIANTNAEINPDGTINLNPNPSDIANSVGTATAGVTKSGVIAYINKFSDVAYKGNDPASELFYESIRYFKHLAPTAEYLNGDNGGFPILPASRWEDPIQQGCQKNFIIGINDANPWKDKKLPGTHFTASTFNGYSIADDFGAPSTPDAAINVTALTNTVGDLEGITGTQQCIGCTAATCDASATLKTIPHLGEVFGTCPYPAKDNTYYIAGLAFYANTNDIRPDLVDTPDKQTISTFMIDTQEYATNPLVGKMNMLWLAGKYGGFIDSNNNGKPDLVDEWDATGPDGLPDGEPDNYVLASDPDVMVTALSRTFSVIESKSASFSSASANSTRVDSSTKIYQAGFDSSNWTGTLKAFSIRTTAEVTDDNGNGVLDGIGGMGTKLWDAANNIPTENSRRILSYNPNPIPATNSKSILFEWANLSVSQKAALDPATAASASSSKILDYIRGDTSNEKRFAGGTFRNRATTVLGDIINSDPVFVGKSENFGYSLLPGAEGSDYQKFRSDPTYATYKRNRTETLYFGANDGMLHGIDANNGNELFAYVPDAVIPALNQLSSASYGCAKSACTPHQSFVDGALRAGDAYISTQTSATTLWRTVLLGTTGTGNGKAIFALDVTRPSSSMGADKVMWEISPTQAPVAADLTDVTQPGFTNNLGYTIPQPAIVRMQDGSWSAVVANGYNSASKKAVLFIINLSTGAIIRSFDTGVGSITAPNGLSTPIPVDVDGDRITDYIYAGDLLGNMWKFDVTDTTNPANWNIAYGTAAVPQPLFKACADAACTIPQPITAKPQVGKNPNGGLMVYFGTGKYFETGDQIVGTSPQVQTFYGIRDKGIVVSGARDGSGIISGLQKQSIKAEASLSTMDIRVTSDDTVNYATKDGWYMDLVVDGKSAKGERVISQALLLGSRIVFLTVIPSDDACVAGGASWLMEFDAVNGKRLYAPPFDINGTGTVTGDDVASKDKNNTNILGGVPVVVSGKRDTNGGVIKGIAIVNNTDGTQIKHTDDHNQKHGQTFETQDEPTGRQSWRQLR